MLGILLVSALGFYGRKWNIPFFENFYHYNYGLLLLLIYWMAYKCIIQPELYLVQNEVTKTTVRSDGSLQRLEEPAKELIVAQVPVRKYQKSGLDSAASDLLYAKLLSVMEKDKPYLEPDLSIFKLAENLGVPRHHLSQVINEKAEKTFFDFINHYRVEEVKRQLADPTLANRNILGLALDSGFNSKATFNAAFKKMAGITPSAYQKARTETYSPRGPVDLG
jgi:AraC-like DNA-binding protein